MSRFSLNLILLFGISLTFQISEQESNTNFDILHDIIENGKILHYAESDILIACFFQIHHSKRAFSTEFPDFLQKQTDYVIIAFPKIDGVQSYESLINGKHMLQIPYYGEISGFTFKVQDNSFIYDDGSFQYKAEYNQTYRKWDTAFLEVYEDKLSRFLEISLISLISWSFLIILLKGLHFWKKKKKLRKEKFSQTPPIPVEQHSSNSSPQIIPHIPSTSNTIATQTTPEPRQPPLFPPNMHIRPSNAHSTLHFTPHYSPQNPSIPHANITRFPNIRSAMPGMSMPSMGNIGENIPRGTGFGFENRGIRGERPRTHPHTHTVHLRFRNSNPNANPGGNTGTSGNNPLFTPIVPPGPGSDASTAPAGVGAGGSTESMDNANGTTNANANVNVRSGMENAREARAKQMEELKSGHPVRLNHVTVRIPNSADQIRIRLPQGTFM